MYQNIDQLPLGKLLQVKQEKGRGKIAKLRAAGYPSVPNKKSK